MDFTKMWKCKSCLLDARVKEVRNLEAKLAIIRVKLRVGMRVVGGNSGI